MAKSSALKAVPLQEYLEQSGLTATELAGELEISQSYLSEIINDDTRSAFVVESADGSVSAHEVRPIPWRRRRADKPKSRAKAASR